MKLVYFPVRIPYLFVVLFFLGIGFFGYLVPSAQAATITWDGGGADGTCGGVAGDGNKWSCGLNWSTNTVPTTADIATFDATSVKNATIDSATTTVGSINMATGYSGTITQATGVALTVSGTSLSDFTISAGTFQGGNGTIDVDDQFTVSGGTFNSTSGTLLIDGGDFTVSSGAFEPGTGNVEFNGAAITVNVAVTETFNNVDFSNSAGVATTITSGDTLVVSGTLTLTDGLMNTGTVDAGGAITQASTYDGGSAVIEFAGAGAQTYTLNGGIAPTIELDSAADASDSITFAAASTINGLTITAGFSGTIPISNASDFAMTVTSWSQAAGTFSGASFSSLSMNSFVMSGGTFTATTTVTMIGSSIVINVVTSQTFNNLVFNGSTTSTLSGDTAVVTGTLTISGARTDTGTINAQGNAVQNSGATGGSAVINFDSASAQTYTINGGTGPVVQLDSAADASDSIVFAATGTLAGLTITSGFSGTIPISNASNFAMIVTAWSQAAGTFSGSSFSSLSMNTLTITGGTFTAPTTVTMTGASSSIDVVTSQTFNNLTFNLTTSATLSGDTAVVTGTLTFTAGQVITGTINAQGNAVQSSGATGGTAIVNFDSASAQTYTINGGTGPVVQLDSSADASDSIVFAAAGTLAGLTITSGFSGTIPITNASDFLMTVTTWTQAAGTFNGASFSSLTLGNLAITGGTFNAPTLVTMGASVPNMNVNVTQTFNNLTVNATILTVNTNDTVTVTGNYDCVNGTIGGVTGFSLVVQGNLTLSSGCDASGITMSLSGSGTQSVADNTASRNMLNGDLFVDKSGGQANFTTTMVFDAASQDLTIQEGTLNFNGQAVTHNGTSATFVVETGGVLKLFGNETLTLTAGFPTLNSGSTVTYTGDGDTVADTITVTSLKTVYHHLTINSTDGTTDTFKPGVAIDINGNFTNTAGTFDVDNTGNYAMTVAGNWTNTGTFVPRAGTVTLDANTAHTLAGATTWFNLTLLESLDDATNITLTLPSAVTQTIGGTLTLDGLDASDKLLIVASTGASAATVNFTGSSTFSGNFLTITDNTATDNSSGITNPINPASSTNGGNTTGWFPITFGGTVYSDEGSTNIGANITVRVLKNGVDTTLTDDTDVSGIWTLDLSTVSPVSGDVLTLYLDDETPNGVTVTRFGGNDVTDLHIFQNFLIVRHDDAGPVTNTNLDTADNADPGVSANDISSIYTVATGTLTTASSSIELLVNTGATFTPGGAIDSNGTLDINGTLSSAANAINVAGHLDNAGTLTHTGILTLDGTTAQTFTPGGSTIGSDIVITNTSAAVSLATNALNIGANDLTINTGAILSLAGQNLTASGVFDNNGTLRARGLETISVTQDIASGTFEYVGNADSAATTFTLPDFGSTDYYNLTIATTDATDILQALAAKVIAGTLSISAGSYDANGNTTTTAGTTTVSGGTYTAGSVTQTFAGLTLSGGIFTGAAGTVDVNGSLTLSSGTFTAPSGSLTLQGNFTKTSGVFTHNSGSVTFDANANHTISGSSSWNNLTLLDSTDNETDTTLTLTAGTTQTINGILTLDGLDATDRLNLVSSTGGAIATLDFQGSSTFSGDFLDVLDNTASDNSTAVAVPLAPLNSVNSGNTTGWFAVASSGGGSGYVAPNAPGTITLVYPNGGEILTQSDTTVIDWTTTSTGISYVDISLSLDGGSSYTSIISDHVNTGFYTWTLPDVSSTEALIKIEGTDLATVVATDVSDAVFTIVGSVPTNENSEPDSGNGDGSDGNGEADIDVVLPNTYIRGLSFPDVYFVDGSLERHPIFNEAIYFTYQDSWSAVRVVSDTTLPTLSMGSAVLPKPGVVLVKIQSAPKVYAVFEGDDGATELRWIQSEAIATEMYGSAWADYVIDIPPTFWTKFALGPDIDQAIDTDLSIMKRRVDLHE